MVILTENRGGKMEGFALGHHELDLVFDMPLEVEKQTPPQRWWTRHKEDYPGYTYEDWVVQGMVHIFDDDGHVHKATGQLRFGQHGYMRGYHFCLAVRLNWKMPCAMG